MAHVSRRYVLTLRLAALCAVAVAIVGLASILVGVNTIARDQSPSALVAILGGEPRAGMDPLSALYRCAGVLTAHDEVTTAAHCLPDMADHPVYVALGVTDICATAPSGAVVVATVASANVASDQATLHLSARAVQKPAVIHPGGAAREGTLVYAYGWGGDDSSAPPSCHPKRVALQVVNNRWCADVIRPSLLDVFGFCATPSEHLNTCTGDSGGPVFDSGSSHLIGITVAGDGCTEDDPGVYSRILE